MNLFGLLTGRRSAPLARERLQILLTHERGATGRSSPGLVSVLREDILKVIAKHVDVAPEKVEVRIQQGDGVAVLAIDVELPEAATRAAGPRERGVGVTGAPRAQTA
jgi:cell division topological specificity factor